jgi:hypothetical protein
MAAGASGRDLMADRKQREGRKGRRKVTAPKDTSQMGFKIILLSERKETQQRTGKTSIQRQSKSA